MSKYPARRFDGTRTARAKARAIERRQVRALKVAER